MASNRRGPPNPSQGPSSFPNTRFISVDNVLQYASEIPSGQPRVPPGQQHPIHGRTFGHHRRPSGGLPNLQSRSTGVQNMPSRTTKISEKLVLLPDTVGDKDDDDDDEIADEADKTRLARRLVPDEEDDNRPLKDEELDVLRKRGGIRGKSYAERLPKVQRGAEKVARLTAYCTAQAYKMKATAEFLRTKHEAKTKLYDDCLYVIYALPLLPGVEGHRVRSRPIMKAPGSSKTVLDWEIERSERRDHHEGYFDDYSYAGTSPDDGLAPLSQPRSDGEEDIAHDPLSPMSRLAPDAKSFAEMFVFSYGVAVFWNFTEHQEKDILADLTFARVPASISKTKPSAVPTSATQSSKFSLLAAVPPPSSALGLTAEESKVGLLTRPLDQDDYETEEFHFEYSADVERPRVFNDMITLLPRSDHMVKLTISHAIAQSTKLCFFEERMSATMQDAQHVPKTLALTGELNLTRSEIVRIQGRLFESRVQINLSSNVLDVPNFFWDSEPMLHPLYVAIREYLEIEPRIKVLNERCRVFLDLANILSDSIADAKMSSITWIIIILIVVSIMITVTEVVLRFGLLERSKDGNNGGTVDPLGLATQGEGLGSGSWLTLANMNLTVEEVRKLISERLSERERMAVCGLDLGASL